MPHWANSILGGWDLGAMGVVGEWPSDDYSPLAAPRGQAPQPLWRTTTGDPQHRRHLAARQWGVYLDSTLATTTMTVPTCRWSGQSGRNAFRGPRFFNTDASLVKRFAITSAKQ